MKMIMIYTACATADECKTIARALLDKQMVACVNILAPITAMYPWKGKLEEATETPMIIKTFASHQEEAVHIIKKMHPYETPGIVCWDADSLDDGYSGWMKENIQSLT